MFSTALVVLNKQRIWRLLETKKIIINTMRLIILYVL